MSVYAEHFLIGLAGAAAGGIGSRWCKHRWHRYAVAVIGVAIETAVTVPVVG